ncbi:S9 family peptidase [Roseateles amylovorans]|uniref:Prolyl oligopeptidase family serine peptidase n=1 Tax=Roseateles amylovorans TaxID=2978473 RepID=A0ABY6AZY4_9BURK|nr:prolyl oligopeptidase family serine peptidase [Roseateles amylovorans]UXH77863.1 prolyl oligopeptidase family serine peptidase [Roseateles amylovorans]
MPFALTATPATRAGRAGRAARVITKSLPALSALAIGLMPIQGLNAAPATALKPVAAAAAAATAPVSAKLPITHDVYATWRSIQGTQLSRNGQWLAYALVAQEADGELVLRRFADGHEWRAERGTAPVFSADGRFVAFAVQPTRAELDKAKTDKKKGDDAPKAGAAWMDLSTGKVEVVERVKRFAWGKDGGVHLAMLLEPPIKKDGAKGDAKAESAAKADEAPDLSAYREADDTLPGIAGVGSDQEAAFDGLTGPSPKKAPGTELILIDAATGQRHSIKDVADFAWSLKGDQLAYSVSVKEAPKGKSAAPATAAASGASATVASTSGAASTPTADAKPTTDDSLREGVYLIDPAEPGKPRVLLAGAGSYKQLRFDEQGRQLAFVSNRDHLALQAASKGKSAAAAAARPDKAAEAELEAKAETRSEARSESKDAAKDSKDAKPDPTPFKLFLWRARAETASVLVSGDTAGMPAGWTPSEHAPLNFSKDGQRLFLSTTELPAPEAKDAPEPMKVDLWHWKDPELQSAQKVKAERERVRSYRAVVHLGSLGQAPAASSDASGSSGPAPRFVQLANKSLPVIQVNENATVALGLSDLPYRPLMSWEGRYMDAYAVDLQTGAAKALGRKLRHPPTLSPTGKYVLGFDAPAVRWLAWRTDTGEVINLTGRIKARFDNDDRDVPDLPSPYGAAGWTRDDDSVVLYDKFDLWSVQPATGKSRNLTQGWGAKQQRELRVVPLDPEDADQKPLPIDTLMLAGTHDITRASGYYRVDAAGGTPQVLIQDDKMIGGLIKAKDADRIVFTQQTFSEFPNLWTSTLTLQSPQKISEANPQQARYAWGTQELIDYTTADGKKLRALLAKPADFDPKKQYPMMVYIYEKMTDNRYRYIPPAPSQNINVARYVSNGYVVLRPDIVYTTGHPGRSAMNTVLPAVRQQIAKGYIDPKRVGIQGHSWGAYQINYLITRTSMFRAAEAGASMANMVSGYGGIRWGAGISRAFQYEHGQSRIGAAPWERPDLYLENSPIFQVNKVTTPYLTIHNDDDDAVPWYQGIEFFTALRRLGKEAYWFNYNGEKHGLRDRDNTKHYTVHMAEFFDHYLLGSPRPAWMDQPVPYLDRGKRDVMGLFKPVSPSPETAVAKGQPAASTGSGGAK